MRQVQALIPEKIAGIELVVERFAVLLVKCDQQLLQARLVILSVIGRGSGFLQPAGINPYLCCDCFERILFDSLDEIAAKANDTVYGLAAGIWTRDIKKAHALAAKIKAGTVWINCYNVFDAAMPFGGYKQSGWGREMGHEVLKNYTEVKSVCAAL